MLILGLLSYLLMGAIFAAVVIVYLTWRQRWQAEHKAVFIIIHFMVYVGICSFFVSALLLFPVVEKWLSLDASFRFYAILVYCTPLIMLGIAKNELFREVSFKKSDKRET